MAGTVAAIGCVGISRLDDRCQAPRLRTRPTARDPEPTLCSDVLAPSLRGLATDRYWRLANTAGGFAETEISRGEPVVDDGVFHFADELGHLLFAQGISLRLQSLTHQSVIKKT